MNWTQTHEVESWPVNSTQKQFDKIIWIINDRWLHKISSWFLNCVYYIRKSIGSRIPWWVNCLDCFIIQFLIYIPSNNTSSCFGIFKGQQFSNSMSSACYLQNQYFLFKFTKFDEVWAKLQLFSIWSNNLNFSIIPDSELLISQSYCDIQLKIITFKRKKFYKSQ